MNQDRVKEILLEIEESELEFSVVFTGKASKKVNGLYKSDTHEILLHNKNFSGDNELLYTAIHEYTHHRICEQDNGIHSSRVHTQRFWSYFHRLLQKAEEKHLYTLTLEESPELLELTDTIRTTLIAEDGKLMKELGRLLGKARILCKQAGIRYEDYIDRVLCLPRASAATMEKMHAFDVKPELGYEAMKVVANIADQSKRAAAEELFLQKNSPAFVRDSLKSKPAAEDPRLKLEKEKRRIERTIESLTSRLHELEDMLTRIPVTPFLFCVVFSARLLFPLTADESASTGSQLHMPAMPEIPEITVDGSFSPPQIPRIQPPVIPRPNKKTNAKTAATGASSGTKQDEKKSKQLNGLSARTVAALAGNGNTTALLENLLGGGQTGSPALTNEMLLTKILAELERLQTKTETPGGMAAAQPADTVQSRTQKTDSAQTETAPPSDAKPHNTDAGQQASSPQPDNRHTASIARGSAAELIRLRINGREIKDDLVFTFCSSPVPEGSFLYGADRLFKVNNAALAETVYFLCRKTDDKNYVISMDLRQEPLNTNSYLHKLYDLTPISITQTSDLIFWHYKAPGLEIELIFRVAEAA